MVQFFFHTALLLSGKSGELHSGNTATISNHLGEKLILTKDALGRITSILNPKDANEEKN